MRLIDADALKKDDELTEWTTRDAIRTGKMLKAFSELFVKKIDDAPTVNAVSEEVYTREYNLRKDAEMKAYKLEKVIDKIRAEILNDWQIKKFPSSPFSCGLRYAVEIIDKYRGESECHDCKVEHDCYKCKKYAESEES